MSDYDNHVQSCLKAILETSPEILTLLANDNDPWVRCRVAKNPNTPPETLTILAKNENSYVRSWVAQNPNTPPETLTLLAKNGDYWVRYYVARNPNTPQYVKDYLIARNFLINFTFS